MISNTLPQSLIDNPRLDQWIGFEEGGRLIDAVRKSPHAVLLLDEVAGAATETRQSAENVLTASQAVEATATEQA